MKNNIQWTKDNIKKLVTLWESHTLSEMEEKMGISREKIGYMAWQIRKKGYPLTAKKRHNKVGLLIDEVMSEMKVKKFK